MDAIAVFARVVQIAEERKDRSLEAKGLILLSTAQISGCQYRAALESSQRATMIADLVNDSRLNGSAHGNIATIYKVMGDWAEADLQSARAVDYLKQVSNPDNVTKILLVRALQTHADMCFQVGKFAEGYRESLEASSRAEGIDDKSQLAVILDMRGAALTREAKITEANSDLRRALAYSEAQHDQDGIAFAKEHLAELELEKPHRKLTLALQLIDEAFATSSASFKLSPQYYPVHIRGKILLESGNKSAAIREFLRAVNMADEWRLSALPGDTTSTQTVAALQTVYADYSQLASEMAIQTHNNALAIKALEVLAANRAWSLREQLRRTYTTSLKLPDEYYFKLSQLQSAQAEVTLGSNKGEDKAQLNRIRLEISDLENRIGLKSDNFQVHGERILRRNSLRDIQRTLWRDQVLISITLGKSRSYLWSVTREDISLSTLPGEEEITSKAELFASAVRNGRDVSSAATNLSRALFGGLSPEIWKRSEWMVVADGPLLNGIPFSAAADLSSATYKPLAETKSLRFLPCELLLLDKQPERLRANVSKNFLGIGDPIYNQADGRIARVPLDDAKSLSSSITLARLVGSEREIRSAAQQSRSVDAVLLTGAKATRENLTAALAREPGVVHFAVHVVSPPDQPQQAALALSIKNGIPELLTPEVISSLHIPGSLVVLSGCSSGQGKVLPGTGLVGLSRAWLLAGAAAVVVSSWPTPDDSGRFFSSFYGHFDQIQTGSTAQRAALALRRTQVDMVGGTGYSTSPSFWGAFAVISKE